MSFADHEFPCPEVEERLIDGLVDGLDLATRSHLESCRGCANAWRELRATASDARAALALRRPLVPAGPILLAASLLLTATAWLASHSHATAREIPLTSLPEANAIVRQIGPHRAAIESGVSTFVITDPRSVVSTPFGEFSCPGGCEFKVAIEQDDCGVVAPALVGLEDRALRMSITVAAGEVASDWNGHPAILPVAHRLTLPFDHYR